MRRVLGGAVAAACAGALLALMLTDVAVIAGGSVSGARHVAPEDASARAGLVGERTFRASAADARARLRDVAAVRDARVHLDVLGTFHVALDEREAIGRWVVGGTEWFIDAAGVLFASRDATAAPALRVRDGSRASARAGDRVDPALVSAALRLAALAPGELRADMTRPGVRIDAGERGLVLESGGRWEVRFGGPERFEEKLAVARQFLRSEPARPLDYVDVRSPERIVFSPR